MPWKKIIDLNPFKNEIIELYRHGNSARIIGEKYNVIAKIHQ